MLIDRYEPEDVFARVPEVAAHTDPEFLRSTMRLIAPIYESRKEDQKNAAEAYFCYLIADNYIHVRSVLNDVLDRAVKQNNWECILGLARLQEEALLLPFVSSLPNETVEKKFQRLFEEAQVRQQISLTDGRRGEKYINGSVSWKVKLRRPYLLMLLLIALILVWIMNVLAVLSSLISLLLTGFIICLGIVIMYQPIYLYFTSTPSGQALVADVPLSKRRQLLQYGTGLVLGTIGIGVVSLLFQRKILPSIPDKMLSPTPSKILSSPTPVLTKNNAFYMYREDQEQIYTAAWSPDDTRIASGGGNTKDREGNNNVYVWESRTGQDKFTYSGHSRVVRMVAWSPNGKLIASASEDMTVQVWDATTDPGNMPLVSYPGHDTNHSTSNAVMAVTWSPDGERLASISLDHNAMVWNASTGNTMQRYPGQNASPSTAQQACIAWSPRGTFIASTTTNNTVDVWNPDTSARLHRFPGDMMVGALAWSPNGRYLAIGYYNPDDSVKIYDINTGKKVATLAGTNEDLVYGLSWSPDGKSIAVGYDWGEVKVWRYETREPSLIYLGHNTSYPLHHQADRAIPYHPIMSVQWSHDGNYIASSGFDQTVQIWTPSA